MGKKKYDPLWQIIDEDVPLQGAEPDVDATCPWCRVTVHLGKDTAPGTTYECGLCGGQSEVYDEGQGPALKRVE